jgi:hypothetical protein
MKTTMLIFFLLFYALLIGSAQADEKTGANEAQSQIADLYQKLHESKIHRVEILHIPHGRTSSISITPEELEKDYFYKLINRKADSLEFQVRLGKVLETIRVQPESEMPDIRWGIIFYDISERRLGAIYLNGYGDRGVVGNIPVSFRGDLFSWLNKNYSQCFF